MLYLPHVSMSKHPIMKYPKIPLAQELIQLCVAHKVKHVVVSPGSRNAPLTIGFSYHPEVNTYSIVDERCAAFFALGIAQELKEPVAVLCTSGSALLNYYPAVAEAYYSNMPLIVLSADRPKALIGIGDGQTINQEHVFQNHIIYEANLVVNATDNQYKIEQALSAAILQQGPVHINIPFSEPLYDTQQNFDVPVKVSSFKKESYAVEEDKFSAFLTQWNTAKKRMVLIGVSPPNTIEQEFLDALGNDNATVVFTESTANVHQENFFPNIDKIIAPLDSEAFSELQPDVLLTLGGVIVSKKIKAFLREYKPEAHYHVGVSDALNTFFCLRHHFKQDENIFLKAFIPNVKREESLYQSDWLKVKKQRAIAHERYLENAPFSDIKVFENVLESVPDKTTLHLSNSSTIRYAQLFSLNSAVQTYCNRGTSGIDGCTSTAIGHATVSKNQHLLITGELSFFYDSNALWNNHIPANFRIIVLNNGGGGIFRILPGDKNTSNFETYFETTHQLTAVQLCEMYGVSYKSATDEQSLTTTLDTFFEDSEQPCLLEVFTPRTQNDEVLLTYFNALKKK